MSLSGGMFELLKEDHARRWRRPLSWWNLFAAWPIPFVLMFCIYSSKNDFEVAKRQRTTVATVTSRDPPNHDRYGYTFRSEGHQFTGWAYPSDKHEFSMGQQIIVYFDPNDPAKNSNSDFRSVGIGDLFFVPFCVLVMVAFPVFIFFQRRARHKIARVIPSS